MKKMRFLTFVSSQEGLILGENKLEEQVTISDSQADHIHIDEIYSKFLSVRPRVITCRVSHPESGRCTTD